MPLNSYSEDEPTALSSVLLVELDQRWCRRKVIVAPTALDLPIGMVMTRRADGVYVPYLLTEEDNQARAILITPLAENGETQEAVVVERGAVISPVNLSYMPDVTAEQQQTALEQLEARGLVSEE